jgi:hypothetical protein
VLGALI